MGFQGRSPDRVVLALLFGSLALNVYLGANKSRLSRPTAPRLGLGMRVPTLQGQAPDERAVSLAYRDVSRPTVLYVFSARCRWCDRNLGNFRALVAARQQQYRFVGVALSPAVASFLKSHSLDVDLVVSPSSESRTAYRFGPTPQTIVVSPDSKVVKVWTGAYTGQVLSELEAFFEVRLPGLLEAEASADSHVDASGDH